ncbi:MAG: hypothetical protein Q8Q29_00640 [Actinomycetota bacterium]|nr:hypothetical protein [Actinomycetota bacterium]
MTLDEELERLRRIEAAARASVEAWDGFRAAAQAAHVWDKPDEVIYQSQVQAELRAALRETPA